MPTYEYRCTDCGQHLEVVQSFTDDPLSVCPACEGSLRKVFSAVGIAFKGSGFYKNDSRSSSSTAKSSAPSGSASAESSGSSAGSSSSSSSSDSGGGTGGSSDSSSTKSGTGPGSTSAAAS